jgi:hypothetical protein
MYEVATGAAAWKGLRPWFAEEPDKEFELCAMGSREQRSESSGRIGSQLS